MQGKVALVTGGTRGIGLSVARRLQAGGYAVVVCARSESPDCPFDVELCDVRDSEAVERMIDGIVARLGRLDLIVNNAGGTPAVPAASASARFSERIIALNLLAPIHVAQAAFKHMQNSGGVIVNVSSVAAIRPAPGTAAYAAAKAGLLALSRSLAHEWGPAIRVNSVVVGYVGTEAAEETYGNAAQQAAIAETLAARRLGRSEDVAEAVHFLASDAASWITGTELTVDGGGERPHFLDVVRGGPPA